jgi:glyoxylase-like metal-dependent hydrolase (beta-lactamase superfamily II)
VPVLLSRFPSIEVIATAEVVEGCNQQLSPTGFERWFHFFPGKLAANQIPPTALNDSNKGEIDGLEFHAIDVEHSDTRASSFLYVPNLRLMVAGDIVYGDWYCSLRQADTREKRHQWLAGLDTIAALDPHIVVPGHKRATQIDGSYLIERTKKYILDFEEELGNTKDPIELEEAMKRRYPERWNDFILESSCKAAFA